MKTNKAHESDATREQHASATFPCEISARRIAHKRWRGRRRGGRGGGNVTRVNSYLDQVVCREKDVLVMGLLGFLA